MSAISLLSAPAETTHYLRSTDTAASLATYRRFRERYRQWYEPVRLDQRTRALTIRIITVRAFITRPPSADELERVRTIIDGPAPVFLVGAGGCPLCVFLAAGLGPQESPMRVEAAAMRASVTAVGLGAELALPTPGNQRRQWLDGLPQRELPEFTELIGAFSGGARRG